MTIWKFTIDVASAVEIEMPQNAELLTVQMQGDRPRLWACVDPFAPNQTRRFRWIGTGQDTEPLSHYIGTVQLMGGSLVFHLFEVL